MFSFFNNYCDKIAQGIIKEASQKIAEMVTIGIKPDAIKIAARGGKIVTTLQTLAVLSVSAAAAYATYNYMCPIKDELARKMEEDKELDRKVVEIRAKQEKQE